MMQIVKKNILSILCGVVVIIAVVVYFVYVSGSLYPNLEAAAKERQANYDKLAGLLTKTRTLPAVDFDKTEPVPMPAFPVELVIKRGQDAAKNLQGQAKTMMDLAVKFNRREPLVPGLFPKASGTDKIAFRDEYERWVMEHVPQLLRAANPPTEEDIGKAEEKLWEEKFAKRIYFVDGREENRELVDKEYNAEIEGLREKMERETAEKNMVYLDPTAITTNPALLKTEQTPDTAAVWYAQTAMWVQEDVGRSIADLNKNARATNIIDAPVKHIVTLDVPQGPEQYIRATTTAGGEEGAAAPATPQYGVSPTGRVSGDKFDVVKFTLVVKMDAAYVPALLQELGRGKFIAIHKVELSSVDSQLAREDGFFYGPNPVVQATISGESLLLREWTSKLVPEVVKKELPGFQTAPAADAAGAVASN
jgi:hypothetical protein